MWDDILAMLRHAEPAFGDSVLTSTLEHQTLEVLRRPDMARMALHVKWDEWTWTGIQGGLERVYASAGSTSLLEWEGLAARAGSLHTENPTVATVLGLYALAGWLGTGFMEKWIASRDLTGTSERWIAIAEPLLKSLLTAEALVTSNLVGYHIEQVVAASPSSERRRLIQVFKPLLARVDKLIADAIGEMALDLHRACFVDRPGARPFLAALYWTLGDIPHAELFASVPSPQPPIYLLRRLVEVSMKRRLRDPLLAGVWHRMLVMSAPTFHRPDGYVARLMSFWSPDDVGHDLGVVYSEAILGLFYHRPPSDWAQFLQVWDWLQTESQTGSSRDMSALRHYYPSTAIRFQALANLLTTVQGPETDEVWARLCTAASDQLKEAITRPWDGSTNVHTLSDYALDLPLFYVGAALPNGNGIEVQLEALERHRAAGTSLGSTMIPPAIPAVSSESADLMEEEDLLLQRLRGARFASQWGTLPSKFRRFRIVLSKDSPPLPKHPGLTREELERVFGDIARQLPSLWDRMEPALPAYVANRRRSLVSLQEFAGMLTHTEPYR